MIKSTACFLLGIVLTIIAGILLIQYAEHRDKQKAPCMSCATKPSVRAVKIVRK